MKIRYIVAVFGAITFIIPLVQLSIGFRYIVKDGTSAADDCPAATDIPLLMAIGGVFALFFLGSGYGFLKMISSISNKESDVSGHAPKILIGLVSFIFGTITLIFFILIQMRVYHAYSNNIQFDTSQRPNYCHSTIMRGALAMVILTFINILFFLAIYILVLVDARKKRQEKEKEAAK